MPVFEYEAIDSIGNPMSGKVEASNQQTATAQLTGQNFRITKIQEKKGQGIGNIKIGSKKPKLAALVVFSRQFATMIDAGIRPVQALDILHDQCTDGNLKPLILEIKTDILQGQSIAEAMGKHQKAFGPLFINMVAAGELGGILATVLDRLASFLEAQQEMQDKIKSAMVYPVVVITFALLITTALIVFVLPKFKEIFDSMTMPDGKALALPKATQLLFALSDIMASYWYIGLGAVIGLNVAFRMYGNTQQGEYNIDKMKLKLPVVGDLLMKICVARFSRTFGTLISAGIPMMRALEIVSGTAGNAVLAKVIIDSREAIREGKRLGESLEASGYLPNLVTQMINIGEDTGRIDEMLKKVADFYEREVDVAIKGLVSMIEPALIVFLGVVIGGIAVSVITPIFALQKALSNH
ncbi:MAG: type II secretion system F family protein [Armatimonadetes bacterium]|nr:type II secretion system F family protein [Armatimonadota bacterium]